MKWKTFRNVVGSLILQALEQCSILQAGPASRFVTSWETFIPYSLAGLMSMTILIKAAMMKRKRMSNVADAAALAKQDQREMKSHTRRMVLAFMLVASFVWNCVCNMPFLVITMGLAYLYKEHPSLSLWVRLLRSVQVAMSPVSTENIEIICVRRNLIAQNGIL